MTALRQRKRRTRARAARAITEVFSPVVLSVSVVLAVGLASRPDAVAGLAWGLVAALFVGVIPYGFLVLGVRWGRWTGRHVPVREQRAVPLSFAAASVLVGIAVLTAGGAPQQLVALVVAGLVGLAVTLAITRYWKMSIHAGVASGTATILTLVFGPWLLTAWPVVGAVGWSRVELGDHTPAEVVAGAVIGALIAGVAFSALR